MNINICGIHWFFYLISSLALNSVLTKWNQSFYKHKAYKHKILALSQKI